MEQNKIRPDEMQNQNVQPKKKRGCLSRILIAAAVVIGLAIIIPIIAGGDSASEEKKTAEDKQQVLVVDSAKVEKLKPNFREKADEFEGHTWVYNKKSPKNLNTNATYVYFEMKDGKPTNPRWMLQYEGEDWLFIHKYILLADGVPMEFEVGSSEHGNSSRVWEWNDIGLDEKELKGLETVMRAKEVKLRSVGSQYNKDRVISDKEKNEILETIEYYFALKGEPKEVEPKN